MVHRSQALLMRTAFGVGRMMAIIFKCGITLIIPLNSASGVALSLQLDVDVSFSDA